jgi:hypothetical protein
MASKHNRVKFTAEEMAYDPSDTSDPMRWVRVGRGPSAIFAKPGDLKTVRLESDVARVFKDSQAVNNALRKLIEAMPRETRKRKTA